MRPGRPISAASAPASPLHKGRVYFAVAVGETLIRQRCLEVLATKRGSRIHRRSFGSNLHLRVFEPNDEVLQRLVDHDVREALEVGQFGAFRAKFKADRARGV